MFLYDALGLPINVLNLLGDLFTLFSWIVLIRFRLLGFLKVYDSMDIRRMRKGLTILIGCMKVRSIDEFILLLRVYHPLVLGRFISEDINMILRCNVGVHGLRWKSKSSVIFKWYNSIWIINVVIFTLVKLSQSPLPFLLDPWKTLEELPFLLAEA